MPPYKIVFFDLDGTLVCEDFHLPPTSIECVRGLRELGLRVCIATGRSPQSAKPYLEDLGIDEYCIFLNGCMIHNPQQNKTLSSAVLQQQASTSFVEQAARAGLSFKVHLHNGDIHKSNSLPWPGEGEFFAVGDIRENIIDSTAQPVVKIVLLKQNGELQNFVNDFTRSEYAAAERLSFFSSHKHYVEVVPSGANKGAAMRELIAHLNLEPAQVIAVGDEENDLELLQESGFGVAVKSGNPLLQEVCSQTIAGPEVGGPLQLLEYLRTTYRGRDNQSQESV